MELPRRGAGYVDLDRADAGLERGVVEAAKAIDLRADGERLQLLRASRRITPVSDRSFESYGHARALLEGPPLPAGIDVPWNLGYADFHFEYPIRSASSDFVLRIHADAAFAERVTIDVRFLPPGGAERIYVL